jgi:hypothetical protein
MFPSIFSLGKVSQSASGDTAGSAKLELGLLERRLVDPLATVTVPFDDGVIFVSSFYSAEFLPSAFQSRPNPRPDLREPVPGPWQRARREVASWLGLSPVPLQRVTAAVGELVLSLGASLLVRWLISCSFREARAEPSRCLFIVSIDTA